jgi:hypothetical protein
VIPNREGRLAQVRASIQADDFAAAERLIHNLVVPTLSLLAFHADVALEITGMLLTERATQIKRFGTTMLGTFQPAPTPEGVLTPPLRLLLATRRPLPPPPQTRGIILLTCCSDLNLPCRAT